MITRQGYTPASSYAPNLAPMVDVVMVILVFFMLGTSLVMKEGMLPTELPSQIGPGGQARITIIPTIRITLQAIPEGHGCTILVMNRELSSDSFNQLEALLRAKRNSGADPKGRIIIHAQPAVEYQNVISALDACVRAGFENIQFAVAAKPAAPVQNP